MKIAIVQDELIRKGGAEQVVLSFHRAFPKAPIYTLSYNRNNTYPEFKNCDIKTSWFGKIVRKEKNLKRFFFPFGILSMKQIHLKGYDIVLQSTTHCAKYIHVDERTTVITYCHTPFRLVFRPDSYESIRQSKSLKRKAYDFVIMMLKNIDKKAAERTDWFITNAAEVVPRIEEAYHPSKKVTVINPPVKSDNFYVSDHEKEYYLVVSRLEPYKKVDLVIDAFIDFPNKKLIVIGSGSMARELYLIKRPNITYMTGLDKELLSKMYANCKALIFPQHEDYGITPLEANASGRPVIAYGYGGVLDTMVPYNGKDDECTAVFFYNQDKESIKKAILLSEKINFNSKYIRKNAERFSEDIFIDKIKSFVKNHASKF